jgi:hypothetical protein
MNLTHHLNLLFKSESVELYLNFPTCLKGIKNPNNYTCAFTYMPKSSSLHPNRYMQRWNQQVPTCRIKYRCLITDRCRALSVLCRVLTDYRGGRVGRGPDQSLPTSAEAKNECSYSSSFHNC